MYIWQPPNDMNIELSQTSWHWQLTELISSNEIEMWKTPMGLSSQAAILLQISWQRKKENRFYKRVVFKPYLPLSPANFQF